MTLLLIALNTLAFAFEAFDAFEPASLIDRFALWPLHPVNADAPAFHLWQLLTYSALHANVTHLAFNMLGLFMHFAHLGGMAGAIATMWFWSRKQRHDAFD